MTTDTHSQLPPSYYGLIPQPPPLGGEAIEPPPGDPPLPPLALPPLPVDPPLMSFLVIPAPHDVTLDADLGELTPLIQTRVILTRSCFRYVNRWHCTQPK